MKVIRILFSIILVNLAISGYPQDGLNNPITKAMMKVYQQLLNEDPQDYETYYKRANEYYNHNQYAKALSDINNALKYMPEQNKDLRFESLCLRASIYEVTEDYENALNDLNKAYILDSGSYTLLYRKANAEFLLKRYNDAKMDYQRMLRINNRSTEALIGLSRIAVVEDNYAVANEFADNAVDINPHSSDMYIRRASIRKSMGNNNGAVEDLIIAISSNDNNSKALSELVEMSKLDYAAVINGLSNAIKQAPKVSSLYYIRGIIAKSHYKYTDALDDFNTLIHDNQQNYHGIYFEIAECLYALSRYNDGLNSINIAIELKADNCKYFELKAKLLMALEQLPESLKCCDIAIENNSNYTPAISTKGLCYENMGNYTQAYSLYGEALLNEAHNPYNYLLRAHLLNAYLNKPNEAKILYERILEINYDDNNAESLKGFAYLALKERDSAINWIENILTNNNDINGRINYIAACLYAQLGLNDKALDCMSNSLQKGYANYHQWVHDCNTEVNVAPIRDTKQFKELISKYSSIFN